MTRCVRLSEPASLKEIGPHLMQEAHNAAGDLAYAVIQRSTILHSLVLSLPPGSAAPVQAIRFAVAPRACWLLPAEPAA